MLNAQIFLKTDQISWKCATLECKPPLAKHASLKTSFSLIPSPSSLFIAVVKFYCLILACWMVVRKHTSTHRQTDTQTQTQTQTHTHTFHLVSYIPTHFISDILLPSIRLFSGLQLRQRLVPSVRSRRWGSDFR